VGDFGGAPLEVLLEQALTLLRVVPARGFLGRRDGGGNEQDQNSGTARQNECPRRISGEGALHAAVAS
jgi:hypothetical protein